MDQRSVIVEICPVVPSFEMINVINGGITQIRTCTLLFRFFIMTMNLLCMNFSISLLVGISSLVAFGCIDMRQFLNLILFPTARLFQHATPQHFIMAQSLVFLPGHHTPQIAQQLSPWLLLKTLSASTPSEKLLRVFAVPFSFLSSTSLVGWHGDVPSDPAHCISSYKYHSGFGCADDMMNCCLHEMHAAFRSSTQTLHQPYNVSQ